MVAVTLQLVGLAALVAFGATFGLRGFLLALALVLLFLGVALSDLQLPGRRRPVEVPEDEV